MLNLILINVLNQCVIKVVCLFHIKFSFSIDNFFFRVVSWHRKCIYLCIRSVQSCLFVQCWPGIFIVQCQGNFCNVGAAFAATGYHQKINWFKIKIAKGWCCTDVIALGFFLCNVVWSLLGNTAQGFYLCNVVPRLLQQHRTGFFPLQ